MINLGYMRGEYSSRYFSSFSVGVPARFPYYCPHVVEIAAVMGYHCFFVRRGAEKSTAKIANLNQFRSSG